MGGRTGTTASEGTAPAAHAKGVLRDYVETILVCVIFVVFSRAFAFQQSKIPSGSMENTLLVGDYIMVNRFVYAPTSFAWERTLLPVRDVQRGDVVVFKYPDSPEIDYIKRIVALPGDTVEMRQGFLYVNGTRQEEPYVEDEFRPAESFAPRQVPDDHYFAMTAAAWVAEPARRTEIYGEFDVVVVGGGPAGLAAAASAARHGASALLVERYGFLGGMGTAGGVTNFAGLHGRRGGRMQPLVRGVAGELLQRIGALGGLNSPQDGLQGRIRVQSYDVSAYKCAADQLLLAAGVQLLFHAWAAGVVMQDDGRIGAVLVETRSGRRAVRSA